MAYDPRPVEPTIYKRWLDAGVFQPKAQGDPYVIVMPPPNVTAVLHMGHGLDITTQDVLIRFERMRGRAPLWLPGTDHAGIATQNVVEKLLVAEGKTRFDVGREAFVARVWDFVKKTDKTILEQLKVIGSSADWTRTRFTLDEGYSRAVREVFVRLWEQQLIYRGHRVIHWCPRCLTALSDEEAEHHDTSGNLYHIKYPLSDGSGFVTVATTRPETMFGDIGLVYHPKDARYKGFKGKQVKIPLSGLAIPIAADDTVDEAFGTGMLKVTPAHDANDFDIANRVWPKAEKPLILTEDAALERSPRVPQEFQGLDRFDARKKIVQALEGQGLLVKVEQHQHAVRRCYRCDTVVEPRLSDQWFVKMKPLADKVMKGYKKEEFRIVPARWDATFVNWMENIRDWNISRQLWWGHRIPVFTCAKCKYQWASRTDPTNCPECDGGGGPIEQDPDVLDTWFSSWLWPFATLGWPDETPDLKRFYPGHTLVTGPDILFFWVARMLMSGYHFMGKRPFSTVFLHGIVRDTKHRKMSKSLGNGIDPLVVVEKFGADALRWTCIANTALGQDLMLDPDDLETTFAPGRNFANKLWNIGQFVLGQLGGTLSDVEDLDWSTLSLADQWILTKAQAAIFNATRAFEDFGLDEASLSCFQFVWRDLADWYVEAVKPRLSDGKGASNDAARSILAYCFDTALRLLHPVVPFITEELWQKLPNRRPEELLAVASWPRFLEHKLSSIHPMAVEYRFGLVRDAVTAIRSIRAEYRIPPKAQLAVLVKTNSREAQEALGSETSTVMRLANLISLGFVPNPQMKGAHWVLSDGSEVLVSIAGVVDLNQECRRLSEELGRLDQQLKGLAARLTNESFVSRAPADVVAREREKEKTWREQRDVLAGKLRALGCS